MKGVRARRTRDTSASHFTLRTTHGTSSQLPRLCPLMLADPCTCKCTLIARHPLDLTEPPAGHGRHPSHHQRGAAARHGTPCGGCGTSGGNHGAWSTLQGHSLICSPLWYQVAQPALWAIVVRIERGTHRNEAAPQQWSACTHPSSAPPQRRAATQIQQWRWRWRCRRSPAGSRRCAGCTSCWAGRRQR